MLTEYAEYIVGIPTFILSSLIAWYIFFKQKKNKKLSYIIENILTVIDSENITNTDIEIHYKHNKVEFLEILTLRVINNGSVPIVENDIVKPVKFAFNNAKILSVRFEDVDQLDTKVNLKVSKAADFVEINFDLLNPNESIQIEVYLNEKATLKVSGRIIGINKIKYHQRTEYFKIILFSIILLMLIPTAIAMIFTNRFVEMFSPTMAYLILFVVIIQIIFIGYTLYQSLPKRSNSKQIDLSRLRRITATNNE